MLHATVNKPADPKPVTVDLDGEPLGVLVNAPEGYRFMAVRLEAFEIDGRTFASVEAARDALRQARAAEP